MKAVTHAEKGLLIYFKNNPDLIQSSKTIVGNRLFAENEKVYAFGEFIANDEIKVEGELIVLEGELKT